MEDKYYIPKIEEFRAGFEFELQEYTHDEPTGGWNEAMFGRLLIHNEGGMYSTDLKDVARWIKDDDVRVKYLDREDIESLKWEHDQTTKDGAVFYIGTLMDEKQWMLTCYNAILRKGEDYTYLSIVDVNDKYNSSNSFQGIVKNKSTLKQVMNMLNIIVPAK